MKRFGMYNDDFNGLFECYAKVSPGLVVERTLPSETRRTVDLSTKSSSYADIKQVKVFIQRHGRGADLAHVIKTKTVDSDDGDGGVILSGIEGEKNFNITTNKKSAQVKMIDSQGNIENDFVTNIAPRFDDNNKELTIIHVEEL